MLKPFFKSLVVDIDGRVSHTKVWSNVANLVATVAFCWLTVKREPSPEIWLIYLGFMSSHAAVAQALTARYSSNASNGYSSTSSDTPAQPVAAPPEGNNP